MRLLCTLALFVLATIARAAEWRNDQYGVSANLPDSAGWQPIEAGNTPEMSILVFMQNAQKQSVFGINVLHKLPTANLRDVATITAVEKSLRDLGYQFFGRATVNVGGREWIQFPVRGSSPPTSGLIRYTSANGHVYVVSLLRGGNQEAAQDPELLAAAASVQIGTGPPAGSVASAPAAPPVLASPGASTPAPPSAPAAPATAATSEATSTETGADSPVKIGPVTLTRQQIKLGLYGVAGLVVLLILLKIIGGGSADNKGQRR